jgi:hypothetical protein
MDACTAALYYKSPIAMIKAMGWVPSYPLATHPSAFQKARIYGAFILTLFLKWCGIVPHQLGNESCGPDHPIPAATGVTEFISRFRLFNARLSTLGAQRSVTPPHIALCNNRARSAQPHISNTELTLAGSAHARASRTNLLIAVMVAARWCAHLFKPTRRAERSHTRFIKTRSAHFLRASFSLSLRLDAIRFCLAPPHQPDRSPRANRIYGVSEVAA